MNLDAVSLGGIYLGLVSLDLRLVRLDGKHLRLIRDEFVSRVV